MTTLGKISVLAIICGVAFFIFRSHYYFGFPTFIAFCCIIIPVVVIVGELLWFKESWQKPVTGLLFAGLFFGSTSLNTCYCSYLLGKKTEIIAARIETEEGDGNITYYYTYHNKEYNNGLYNSTTNYTSGEYIKLKVSVIDPTVSEVVQ